MALLVPAFLLMCGLLTLLAGAVGDARLWPELLRKLYGEATSLAPAAPSMPTAAVAAAAAQHPAPAQAGLAQKSDRNALQQHDLQARIALTKQGLASLRSTQEQDRQRLDTLHQQRATELLAQLRAREPSSASDAPATGPAPQPNTPQPNAPQPKVQPARPPAITAVTPPPSPQPEPAISPLEHLAAARQALTAGRPDEARRELVLAQIKFAFQPVTPDQPIATGNNMATSQVGDAIRSLDGGDRQRSLQVINLAIGGAAIPTANAAARPVYPGPVSSSYPYSAIPPYPSTSRQY